MKFSKDAPKVEEEQRIVLENCLPRDCKLRRKRVEEVEGWKVSIFPLTTAEVQALGRAMKAVGLK